MTLRSEEELAITREKLERLEIRFCALQKEQGNDESLRKATLKSLKRYINQFKEEIAVYRAHDAAHR